MLCSVLCLLCFVRVCLYVLCGHLLGKGWPLGSRLWCLLWVCHFPIGILGQVWYLIVSIPDLCTITYFSCNTGPDPLKKSQLPSQHSMLCRHRHTSETPFNAFRWRADDDPLIVVLGSSLPSSTKQEKKNVVKVGPPLTKPSGSAHVPHL